MNPEPFTDIVCTDHICYLQYVATYKFYFSENTIKLEFSINVSLTMKNEVVKGVLHQAN